MQVDLDQTFNVDLDQLFVTTVIIKSGAMTLSRSPQCRAFYRALMDEKLLSPLFPIGGVEGGGQCLQMTVAQCTGS